LPVLDVRAEDRVVRRREPHATEVDAELRGHAEVAPGRRRDAGVPEAVRAHRVHAGAEARERADRPGAEQVLALDQPARPHPERQIFVFDATAEHHGQLDAGPDRDVVVHVDLDLGDEPDPVAVADADHRPRHARVDADLLVVLRVGAGVLGEGDQAEDDPRAPHQNRS